MLNSDKKLQLANEKIGRMREVIKAQEKLIADLTRNSTTIIYPDYQIIRADHLSYAHTIGINGQFVTPIEIERDKDCILVDTGSGCRTYDNNDLVPVRLRDK